MRRRDFTRSILAAGLAAPPVVGPVCAFAHEPEAEGREGRVPRLGRIALTLAAIEATVVLQWILVVFPGGIRGWDVRGDQSQFEENRAGLGGALGGLTRPLVADRLRGLEPMGSAVLYGQMLVLLPLVLLQNWRLRLLVAHRALSWETGLARSVAVPGLPSLEVLAALQVVGRLWLSGNLLIATVPPVAGLDDR